MTDAELAILSIIAEAPITGYDLQSVIDQRNLRAWTLIGVESVYYLIEKLAKQGLIEGLRKEKVDSAQQQYRITGAGIGVLQTAVSDMLSSPRTAPNSFDIGLANLPVLKTSQVRHALYSYRNGLQQRFEALSNRLRELQVNSNPPFHIFSMFEHQLSLIRAEMTWFDKWIKAWEMQAPPEIEEASTVRRQVEVPRMQQRVMPDDPDSVHKQKTRVRIYNDKPSSDTRPSSGTKRMNLDDLKDGN